MTRTQEQWLEMFRAGSEGLKHMSTGPLAECETCRRDYGIKPEEVGVFDESISNGAVPNEPYFGKHPCALCSSGSAGDREPAHGIDSNGELVHIGGVCVDCVTYLANGDLPQ